MSVAVNRNRGYKENERNKKMSPNKKDNVLRSGSDFLVTLCMQILALWVAFGDAILEFVASYVKVFDDVHFDDGFSNTPDPAVELGDFRKDVLNTHNHCRALHGCPALKMSGKLTSSAQAWANKLVNERRLLYSEIPGLGENICLVDLDKPAIYSKGEQIAREWYSEIDNYDFSVPGWKRGSFRATQLLWKDSKEMGVGVAKVAGHNKIYMVVHYWPPGNSNTPGEFQRNVLPRKRP